MLTFGCCLQRQEHDFLAEACGAMKSAHFTAARFHMEHVLGTLSIHEAEAYRAATMKLVPVVPLVSMEIVEAYVVRLFL